MTDTKDPHAQAADAFASAAELAGAAAAALIPGMSPLAIPAKHMRDVQDRPWPAFGIALHTTGSELVPLAKRRGVPVMQAAVDFYCDPDAYFPHYVIGHKGEIVQIANEREKAQHLSSLDRERYLDGSWLQLVKPKALEHWRAAWPRFKSPFHLFPGASANAAFTGIEMIPVTGADEMPAWPGQLFTEAQYQAAARLCSDIGKRQGFPAGWWKTSRLLGHEDVGILDRQDAGGTWDPGALRDKPYFDMARARELVGALG